MSTMNVLAKIVDYGVMSVLLLLSVWAVSIAVERWLFFRRIDLQKFQSTKILEMTLTYRLTVIGTVAANAPYIGLLGTVLAIMFTFHAMSTHQVMDVSRVMLGLSLALKATALGLVVAIPCVALNNALRRKVRELMTQYEVQHGS
jgi:biopolymer transport protein ExbB